MLALLAAYRRAACLHAGRRRPGRGAAMQPLRHGGGAGHDVSPDMTASPSSCDDVAAPYTWLPGVPG
jgi:ribosomal protein L2